MSLPDKGELSSRVVSRSARFHCREWAQGSFSRRRLRRPRYAAFDVGRHFREEIASILHSSPPAAAAAAAAMRTQASRKG